MSVIGKKPLINIVLEGLNKEQLQNLKANLDANVIVNYADFVALYKSDSLGQVYVPTFNTIFIKPYVFKFEPDEQHLRPYLLNSDGKLDKIDEELNILELRSALADRLIEAGAIVPENVKFTVSNIKALTDAECNDLKVGDMVAKKTGNQYHVYVVTYKEKNQGMCLTYADASVVETQSYDYTAGHWVYNSEDKTSFADIGGLPVVTADDNNKVLEVLNGAWGKGGKKVNVINAPSSTTLTDEEYNQIKEGVFINGEFVNLINPIIFPFADKNRGLIIGKTKNSYDFEFKMYYVSSDTKEFTIEATMIKASLHTGKAKILIDQINNKSYPEYPSNASIGQFICRKGVLQYYIPVAQDNITSGDTIALDSALGKALLDHLDVEINGFRARYEYTSGNYVVYSSKTEADGGLKLQVNMISYNTTNGELSFNQMTFTPDN